jgi:hypothetical protein
MDSIYEAYGITSDTDTSDENEELIIRPSEIVSEQKPLKVKCQYDTDSDSDDYDENNIIAVGRRRKSFIRNSLTQFSKRASTLPDGVKKTIIHEKRSSNHILSYLCCFCFKPNT